MALGKVLLRITLGGLFVGHGTQKLFGWFGGAGPEGTGRTFDAVDLRPGRVHARVAGVAEAGGGMLLAAGLATPLASASLSGVMLTAIRSVHWRNGIWSTQRGYELPLVMLVALFALTEAGPGAMSLDGARRHERKGIGWAVAALASGAIASHLAILVGRRSGRHVERVPESPQGQTRDRTFRQAA
jgi:putative oxidoreductase